MHALYYAALHLLFQLVPYSPFVLRLPSALAVGGCTALVALLAGRLAGRRTGLIAGAVAALLPALTWAGGEGRSSAVTALLATASTAALLLALRLEHEHAPLARRRLAWIGYGLLAALMTAVFLDAALIVVAHLVTAAVLRMRSPVDLVHTLPHALPHGLLVAAGGGLVLDLPLVLTAARQSGQVAWIDGLDARTPWQVLVQQSFPASPAYAALAWVLLGAAVVSWRRDRPAADPLAGQPWPAADPAAPSSGRSLITAVALPWLLVPTAALLGATALGLHVYLPRYLTMSAPAVALLLAVAIAGFRPRRAAAALVALSVLAVPQLVGSRLPEAKQHSTWAAVAASVARDPLVSRAAAPVPVVYGPLAGHGTATTHIVATAYPAAFAHTIDVTALHPLAVSARLWEPRRPLGETIGRLGSTRRVLLIVDTTAADRTAEPSVLAGLGFRTVRTHRFGPIAVLALRR